MYKAFTCKHHGFHFEKNKSRWNVILFILYLSKSSWKNKIKQFVCSRLTYYFQKYTVQSILNFKQNTSSMSKRSGTRDNSEVGYLGSKLLVQDSFLRDRANFIVRDWRAPICAGHMAGVKRLTGKRSEPAYSKNGGCLYIVAIVPEKKINITHDRHFIHLIIYI